MLNEMVLCNENAYLVKHASPTNLTLRQVTNYTTRKEVYGIHARNQEQNLALNHLMDPDIDFVSLLGPAGTGKTLLTLAAALEQTMEDKRFEEVIFTRATVPMGEDIGFLPGTEDEKMSPWMGALFDNLEVLTGGARRSGKEDRANREE
jgi:PhoH-like ATPase